MPPPRHRPHMQLRPLREGPPGPDEAAGGAVSLRGISRGDAAAYIGDMAAGLHRIAADCDLEELTGLLARLERAARMAAKGSGAPQRQGI